MSEMVERVMQAIRVNVFQGIPREEAEAAALAAIEAMREPTEAMIEEGAYAIPIGQGCEEGPPNLQAARECWQAMISAALSERALEEGEGR